MQAYENSKADWESSTAARVAQQRQLSYYDLTAPFAGVVGDIPVHVGDYVSPQTLLTTVDENAELEAYIYIPTERSARYPHGPSGADCHQHRRTDREHENLFYFAASGQCHAGHPGEGTVHGSLDKFRNAQLVKARVIWSTAPAPTVPVLAVTRIGGQTFVYVAVPADNGTVAKQRAVTLGDTIGNDYAVTSGLKPGDKVIVSGTQFLIDGAPVQPTS